MKNGHSEDETFHSLVNLKILRVILFYESFTLKLIGVKGKVSPEIVLSLFSTSFRCL